MAGTRRGATREARPFGARRPAPAAAPRRRPASADAGAQLELFPLAPALAAEPLRAAPPALPPPANAPTAAAPRPAEAPLSPAAATRRLHRRLAPLLGDRALRVVLTENRSTALSSKRSGNQIEVRIHRGFVDAPDEVLAAIATFLLARRRDARTREALGRIREHFARVRSEGAGIRLCRDRLRPVGRHHDLRAIRDELLATYFRDADGRPTLGRVAITWGNEAAAETARRARQRRAGSYSLKLGSYSFEDRVVRIHPVLDGAEVPRYVVESVVHHELLHAALQPVLRNGRRYVHTPEFRRREREFRNHLRAERWIAEHLHALAHRGRPAAR